MERPNAVLKKLSAWPSQSPAVQGDGGNVAESHTGSCYNKSTMTRLPNLTEGASGELIVSARDDMTGEPTLWHHAECQGKKDAETAARIEKMNRRIAEQVARDEYEEK